MTRLYETGTHPFYIGMYIHIYMYIYIYFSEGMFMYFSHSHTHIYNYIVYIYIYISNILLIDTKTYIFSKYKISFLYVYCSI